MGTFGHPTLIAPCWIAELGFAATSKEIKASGSTADLLVSDYPFDGPIVFRVSFFALLHAACFLRLLTPVLFFCNYHASYPGSRMVYSLWAKGGNQSTGL